MQGVGAVNMSMGGAATAQPLDINGAIHWNPATLSNFNGKILSVSANAVSSLFATPFGFTLGVMDLLDLVFVSFIFCSYPVNIRVSYAYRTHTSDTSLVPGRIAF